MTGIRILPVCTHGQNQIHFPHHGIHLLLCRFKRRHVGVLPNFEVALLNLLFQLLNLPGVLFLCGTLGLPLIVHPQQIEVLNRRLQCGIAVVLVLCCVICQIAWICLNGLAQCSGC